MKSILSKFLCVVIGALMLMTAVVSGISLFTTNDILHRDADVILENMCQKEAALFNEMLSDVEQTVRAMEYYALTELEGADALTDEAYRTAYTSKVEKAFVNIAVHTEGVAAFYLRLNPEWTDSTAGFFISANRDTGEFISIPPTDLLLYDQQDLARVGWYYEPVKAGKAIWMEPYFNQNNEYLMVSYVSPLYLEGTLIGVIGMDVDFSRLTDTVNRITVFDDGHAYLFSADSQTIHNRQGLEPQVVLEEQRGYTHASAALDNGMTLLVCASYEDIQQDSYAILNRFVLAFMAVLLLSILVTVIITRQIVAPLRKLTQVAEELAQGHTDVDLTCHSKDEIGTLARVLQQTTVKVRENIGHINALAYRDSLTGIRNRTAYAEFARQMEGRMKDETLEFAVLVGDLNDLKVANDHYGHDAGNELIIAATQNLCDTYKRSPVFRIGGDEFVVIMENQDYQNREQLLETLDQACADTQLSFGDGKIRVSVARGMAVYEPDGDTSFEDVFNRADQAMYRHKQMLKASRAGK